MNLDSENHFVNRSNWLRAAILGANDGILSTASIVIGVAAAATTRESIILAGIAGLVAGALSMAAGEYVSVSSQSDIESADLNREQQELDEFPEEELHELAKIYKNRGLTNELSLEVAKQLTQHNALEAHARDELGINDISQAKPLQAAFASGAAFVFGGILPIIVALYVELNQMIIFQYSFSILFLALLGAVAAKTGGSSVWKSIIRITFWGTLAMLLTALIGYLFGVTTA
ncbi:VIT family protein [Bacteroidia bacterium]|jgi:VIT1/CCC1 family predicted Fe2+/Mn2+ transporter|nr:VIT family protein [Bacteroidia bacterium]MDC3406325.1 VIT family protein [Bacteroidia bacterium]